MTNKRKTPKFNLEITPAAYDAVLNCLSDQGFFDQLPLLIFDKEANAYSIGSCSPSSLEEKIKNISNSSQIVYQVGRLRMCIEDEALVAQVDGKTLDHANGEFFIR